MQQTDPKAPNLSPSQENHSHPPPMAKLRAFWRAYRQKPTQKVGFWLGLLLLFAPIFYFLLYFKPFTVKARTGWGLWLGFIVFVKLSGMADPVVDFDEAMDEIKRAQEAGIVADVREPLSKLQPEVLPPPPQPETPPKPPSLPAYLKKLGGGFLGMHMEAYTVEDTAGKAAITLRFKRHDGYFDTPETLALAGVSSAFSLMYGWDFRSVTLRFNYRGSMVRMVMEREAYNRFFGQKEAQMQEFAQSSDKFRDSPVRNITPEEQLEFLRRFSNFGSR